MLRLIIVALYLYFASLQRTLMPITQARYSNNIVQPLNNPDDLLEIPVALKASTVYPAGAAVGEILGTIDVQHIHAAAVLTGGAYSVSDGVNTSPSIQWNAVSADVQAALNAATPGPIVYNVAGGPLNTGPVDFTLTRQGVGVQALLTFATNTTAGGALTFTHPTVGTAGSNGTYGLYASGNTDGTQIPRGILRYPCTTDATGLIAVGDWGFVENLVPLAYGGTFRLQDLAQPGNPGGIDANAVTAGGWRIIEGAVGSNGILVIPV